MRKRTSFRDPAVPQNRVLFLVPVPRYVPQNSYTRLRVIMKVSKVLRAITCACLALEMHDKCQEVIGIQN